MALVQAGSIPVAHPNMTPDEIKEELAALNPEALFADGLDGALVGIGQQFNRFLAVYDYDRCIAILANEMPADLEPDEQIELAREHFEYNVVGSWAGANTPIFLRTDMGL